MSCGGFAATVGIGVFVATMIGALVGERILRRLRDRVPQ
jgi:hypothetical protein